MQKKILLLSLLLVLLLTAGLLAQSNDDRWSLDIQVTVCSSTNGTVTIGYIDSNNEISHNHTQQFQINYGENILNYHVDIWPGQNPDPHIVFADGENEHGCTDYDEEETYGNGPIHYLELYLGLGHTDPTIPENN
ncbi:MAG: hypothetical protein SVM86_08295 [Candidatus Cloacimonadota bacterium]|nr:hypothetical protein [Candidatus Cloacimonadota bacterium]